MKVSNKLSDLYGQYYNDSVAAKRAIAAHQTVDHLVEMLPKRRFASLVDIGAGEGAVLAEIEMRGLVEEMHALEISSSGVAAIRLRQLATLRSVEPFDGYKLPEACRGYDLAIAAHVVEHVEHERAFIAAIVEAAELVYIEVPLELTARVERSIRMSGPYGHINFYTPETIRNLVRTSGAEIVDFRVFPNSLDYERYVSGPWVGSIKYLIRVALLRAFPKYATHRMTYLAGLICRKAPA